MKKNRLFILKQMGFAVDDYLSGNISFDEFIATTFFVCYRYLEKKGV